MRRSNVEQDDLVGAFTGVARGLRSRIAGIDEIDELHALDYAPGLHVEARDDALGDHSVPSHLRKLLRILSPAVPDFSGWNWTPITLPRSTADAKGSM